MVLAGVLNRQVRKEIEAGCISNDLHRNSFNNSTFTLEAMLNAKTASIPMSKRSCSNCTHSCISRKQGRLCKSYTYGLPN